MQQRPTGSWTKSRQWGTERTLFSSARATMCPLAKVNGVWPFNDAWLRTSLEEVRRQAPRNVVSILDSAKELGIRDAQVGPLIAPYGNQFQPTAANYPRAAKPGFRQAAVGHGLVMSSRGRLGIGLWMVTSSVGAVVVAPGAVAAHPEASEEMTSDVP